jgi:hypothetical protein
MRPVASPAAIVTPSCATAQQRNAPSAVKLAMTSPFPDSKL